MVQLIFRQILFAWRGGGILGKDDRNAASHPAPQPPGPNHPVPNRPSLGQPCFNPSTPTQVPLAHCPKTKHPRSKSAATLKRNQSQVASSYTYQLNALQMMRGTGVNCHTKCLKKRQGSTKSSKEAAYLQCAGTPRLKFALGLE